MLHLGSTVTERYTVDESKLAIHWEGDFRVLSTPNLLGLVEFVCMKALKDQLEEDIVTVGTGFNVQHLAPTPEHFEFQITATLARVKGRKLIFEVTAHDGQDEILTGTHERAWVNKNKFESRIAQKNYMLNGEELEPRAK